jgi:putative tryptophan/tyrosine transport system substrate-binding protein
MRRREFIAGLGGAAAWPLAARAQQPMPVVGLLDNGLPRPNARNVAAFRRGLAEAGFVEGRTVQIEYRWANFQMSASVLAEELVQRRVAVIVALSGPAILAAKTATSTIPIVFTLNADPIKFGLVVSLSRPGGNMTGVTGLAPQLTSKRLDLLREIAPLARTVAYLTDPAARGSDEAMDEMIASTRALGRQAIILETRNGLDIDAAFATLVERGAGALVVASHLLFRNFSSKIVNLAARHSILTIYPGPEFVTLGGLMSYSADVTAVFRQVGSFYVAQILKGANPGDLPVQQPTKFEFVINLKTAKALGLTIPPTLLAVADEVIEDEPLGGRTPRGWNLVPTITVVSPAGDPRLPLVADAVAFWNDTFAELGTSFRLGALTNVTGAIPVGDLMRLYENLPESLNRIAGNIVVALSEGEFISFTARWPALNKAVVAIKDYRSFPLTLPNVARNVIAQLLGIAIGLSQNAGPTALMCGRPAPCRPDLFAFDRPKYFPLTEAERADLEQMYPKTWQAS